MQTMLRFHRKVGCERGFTLIELGIVIAIAAVLAATILPSIVEVGRNRSTERAAQDIVLLKETARNFFLDNTVWPGENPAIPCAVAVGAMWGALQAQGFVNGNAPTTPWGAPYLFVLHPSGAAPGPGDCLLEVRVQVPNGFERSFMDNLPMTTCANVGGIITCSSFAAREGGNFDPCAGFPGPPTWHPGPNSFRCW